MDLNNADDDVKLAVDLIELLEVNEIPVATVISALKMVLTDYQQKLLQAGNQNKND